MHFILLKNILFFLSGDENNYDFGNIAIIQKDPHLRKVAMRFENCNAVQ